MLKNKILNFSKVLMVKRIKLMPDYNCYPIWDMDEVDNINPQDLPLKTETIHRLNAWADLFECGLDWHDPGGKSLWSEEDTNLYQQEGLSLWHQLHQELTPEYKVYYFSDRRFLQAHEISNHSP